MKFWYTYVLKSLKDCKLYIGYTRNLKLRIKRHQDGEILSTKNRLPVEIVYFEGCTSKIKAISREKYFKTGFGRRYLKNRI
jgi:putative endonuclease